MIYNVFDKEYIHEVVICDEIDGMSILQMYITETNDLFVVTKYKLKYSVLLIDLDHSNIMEFKGSRFDYKDQFAIEVKLEYFEDDVDFKKLSKLHIRGSSRKEAIDMKNELFVFVLHGDSLYSWTENVNTKL